MLGVFSLGVFCGILACILVPGDMFRDMTGPVPGVPAHLEPPELIFAAMAAALRQ